jgi:hypothetical protein
MAKPAVGDPTYYQGKKGAILGFGSCLVEAEDGTARRQPTAIFQYPLPADEAMERPHVTLWRDPEELDELGKPMTKKIVRDWNPETDGVRMARTTAMVEDLRWDTGRAAWIVNGHGLKKNGGYWPDASHPENVRPEREG